MRHRKSLAGATIALMASASAHAGGASCVGREYDYGGDISPGSGPAPSQLGHRA